MVGLIAWIITRHGDAAILFSIVADALAAAPTLRKAWIDPESESAITYGLSAVGSGITLLTFDTFTFTDSAFAIYLFSICIVLFSVVQFRPGPRLRARSAR